MEYYVRATRAAVELCYLCVSWLAPPQVRSVFGMPTTPKQTQNPKLKNLTLAVMTLVAMVASSTVPTCLVGHHVLYS